MFYSFLFYNINGRQQERTSNPISHFGFCRRNKIVQAGNLCSLHVHRIPNRMEVEWKQKCSICCLDCEHSSNVKLWISINCTRKHKTFDCNFCYQFGTVALQDEREACWSLIRLADGVIDESLETCAILNVLIGWSNRILPWVEENGDGPKIKNRTEWVVILLLHYSLSNK